MAPPLPSRSIPDLTFTVEGAEAVELAAAPTVRLLLRIEASGGTPIRSMFLRTQIRIAVTRRTYDAPARERLVELFGEPHRWGTTARSLLWTNAVTLVPPFAGETLVDVPILCTYDFEVAASKYFHALEDGEIPLQLLFSGTVFYDDGGVLRTSFISWENEAAYRLPVRVWREMMDHYFPGSAWLRLRRETFDRFYAFKASRMFPTWDEAMESLLAAGGGERG